MKQIKKLIVFTLIAALQITASCAGGGQTEEIETDDNARRMQSFVINISSYARSFNKDFIIIPQNGSELAFNNTEPDDGIMSSYIRAIDGIGIEELFYNGSLDTDIERLTMLKKLKTSVKIIVSDFVSNNENISEAESLSLDEGFICFPRSADNYNYELIPENIKDENTNDINSLNDAQNFLYLISSNNYSDKEAMITDIEATNYDIVLIDLFSFDEAFILKDINRLKRKANGGKRLVISYISIGSAENYRYYWQDGWKKGSPSWLRKEYSGYPDEFWVEFWHRDWQNIIFGNDSSYMKKIIDAGFDGAYLDNVESYYFLEN